MERDQSQEVTPPKDFDLEEILQASGEDDNTVYGGKVEAWEILELIEKARIRPYITKIVISVWAITMIANVLRLLLTGDFSVAVPSALITVPLYMTLKFYFKSG